MELAPCFGRCIGAHLGSGHGRRHLWTFLGDLKAKIKAKEGRNRPKKGFRRHFRALGELMGPQPMPSDAHEHRNEPDEAIEPLDEDKAHRLLLFVAFSKLWSSENH